MNSKEYGSTRAVFLLRTPEGRSIVFSTMADPFANITEEKINKMVGVLASLPPLKQQPIIETLTETCVCNKKVPISRLQTLHTGVFKTLNDVCKGCKQGCQIDAELARVVCAGCKRVIIRIKPAVDKTGFEFKAGKTYHVSNCSLCSEDYTRCPIIEKVLHDQSNKVK